MLKLCRTHTKREIRTGRIFAFIFIFRTLTGQEKWCSAQGVRMDGRQRGNFQHRHKSQKLSADSLHLETLHFSKVQEQDCGGEDGRGVAQRGRGKREETRESRSLFADSRLTREEDAGIRLDRSSNLSARSCTDRAVRSHLFHKRGFPARARACVCVCTHRTLCGGVRVPQE